MTVSSSVKKKYQQQMQEQILPLTDGDKADAIYQIDLSNVCSDDELGLNQRTEPIDIPADLISPPEYFYLKKIDQIIPRYIRDRQQSKPTYRNLAGQRVTPTRINSLLAQNLSGKSTRPPSQFYWTDQPDEGYYIAKAKQNLAWFLASTRENYYLVDENSKHRLKFKCPKHDRGPKYGPYPLQVGTRDQAPARLVPILIHINPSNDQAVWYCPRCSKLNSKDYGGSGRALKHTIPRDLRDELAKEDILPIKEWKHKDRIAEIPKLLDAIMNNPGAGFAELDQVTNWPSGTAERIINTQLKDRVELRKGRKGQKGYKVYIKH